MAVKAYQMPVQGFIPGLPGVWPAGSTVLVDENEQTGELQLVKQEAAPNEHKIEELEEQIHELEDQGK